METITTWGRTLAVIQCGNCGVDFAIPSRMLEELRATGKDFWCPNGHNRVFRETTEQRLRKQLDSANARARHEADQRQASERSNRALRGVNTRMRNRAAAGVCQCCKRTFQNVAQHMASQHPDYAAAEVSS